MTSLEVGFNHFFLIHRNPIRYLLVSLAVADFMYAAFIAPSSHPDGLLAQVYTNFLPNAMLHGWEPYPRL